MTDPETIINTFHDPAYAFQSSTGVVHRVEGGKVLCGSRTWLYAVPRELVADRLPDHACGNCRRVQLARRRAHINSETGG